MEKNIIITYDKAEQNLVAKYYEPKLAINWNFCLYESTDEMVQAGKILHNSLACQRGMAVDKTATFLYVKDEYDQIIGCISLKRNDDKFIVWEFEFLKDFEPKHRQVVFKWFTENNIDADGAFDIRKVRGNTYAKHIGIAV